MLKMELICDGELLNEHSDFGGNGFYGWVNPLDVVPPVGSTIEYMTFNVGNSGVLTKYKVKEYIFTTEEAVDHSYRKKVCKIFLEKLDQ